MNNSAELANAAVLIAIRGAHEYLLRHNLKFNEAVLTECLGSWVKIKLPEALNDAKQAFECGMTQAGLATFKASMIQAGIEAAKECGMPIV